MDFRYRRFVVLPLIALATSALAQDQGDWDLVRDDRKDLVAAYLSTTTGLTLLFRCQKGAYTAFIAGLPRQRGETRALELSVGDAPLRAGRWTAGDGGTSVFSDYPAPFARELRQGGRLQLRLADGTEDGRPVRYVIDLPPSTTAIDQTLTACERPLVDPRDAEIEAVGENGLPTIVQWVRTPQITFPSTQYAKGFAVVSCIADGTGQVRDCVIETEHPFDGRFGKATLEAMRSARLGNRLNPDAPIPPSRFTFRANFVMAGYESAEDTRRAREAAAARREARRND